jgi:hypothetical protein
MTRMLLILTLLFTSLYAKEESYPFFGIQTSFQKLQFKSIVTDPPNRLELSDSEDFTTFGLRYGMQTKDYRTAFSYDYTDDFQTFDVGVDYILMDSMFGTPKVRPYVGATVGYIIYDEARIVEYNENRISSNEDSGEDTTVSTSDGYYGFDLGLLFYVSDNVDIDIGYHYYYMNRLEPLDIMSGFTISLHYFY